MANNQYANKLVVGGEVKFDLTGDTATEAFVARGKTFHNAKGAKVTGTSTFTVTGNARSILVTAPTGSAVYAAKDGKSYTAKESAGTWNISVPDYGMYTVTAEKDGQSAGTTVEVSPERVAIDPFGTEYTVSWNGSSSTALTRKGEAAALAEPVPYVKGAASYSSPFDKIAPWKNIVRVTDGYAGEMVKIPKFWYKLTKDGSELEISITNSAKTGFSVCPACMDRGDGKGERNYVLVGRYHCANGTYKSAGGVKPQVNVTRAEAREAIAALGDGVYQWDFATRFTIWLLYIVEYADWDSQKTIGYGCSVSGTSAVFNTGETDAMPYHTGTTQTARTTYGPTQYRYIEGLWDNCFDWLDGCSYSGGLNITLNLANFSDDSVGQLVSKMPYFGYTSALGVSSTGGFPMFYQSYAKGSASTYIPDTWGGSNSSPCLYCGGSYEQKPQYGLFSVFPDESYYKADIIGCRSLRLP